MSVYSRTKLAGCDSRCVHYTRMSRATQRNSKTDKNSICAAKMAQINFISLTKLLMRQPSLSDAFIYSVISFQFGSENHSPICSSPIYVACQLTLGQSWQGLTADVYTTLHYTRMRMTTQRNPKTDKNSICVAKMA